MLTGCSWGQQRKGDHYAYWTVHHCNSWRIKDQLDVTCYLISLLMYSTCFGRCAPACNTDTTQTQPHHISDTQRTENNTTDVVIQQHSRKLLIMDILISETCWVRKKWNKIASDMKLVFYSSKGHRFNDLGIGGWTVLKWELNMREGMERFYLARTETSGSLF